MVKRCLYPLYVDGWFMMFFNVTLCLYPLYVDGWFMVFFNVKLCLYPLYVDGWFMMFNVTFNNSSVISWLSAVLVEGTGVPGENHRTL